MSTDVSIRAPKGTVTLGQLSDYNRSLYITNVGDYYDTEYKVNPHNGKKYEAGKVLNRKVRESLYDYLMEAFSTNGKEPRDICGKILSKFSPDSFYDEVVQLDGIGVMNAILSTIAMTGMAPSVVKNLASDVAEAMFVRSDKSTIVANEVQNITPNPRYQWSYRDDYSTALDLGVAARMLEDFTGVVRRHSGFKESALPTPEEIMKEVGSRTIKLSNGKIMLKSQYNIEQRLLSLCSETTDEVHPNRDDEYLDMLRMDGLDAYQRKAFDMVVEGDRRVCIITGKAGTGKSHVISAIFRAFHGQCVLTAYQNSACDVLSRRVGGYVFCDQPIKAVIGLSMKLSANFKFAEEFEKTAKVIIVDESSQLGTYHMYHVLNILNHAAPGAKLVLVGDVLQTRPVCTYGIPFVHLARKGLCPVADLAEFHRTNGRGILELCEKIRAASNSVVFIEPGTEGVELQQVPETDKHVSSMCKSIADDYIAAGDDVNMCMVVAETNNECDMVNRRVTSVIFNDPIVETGLPRIREGMVVVSTTNMASYSKDSEMHWKITNGSRYYIVSINPDTIELKDRNGDTMSIPMYRISRNTFKVAYAITVHKSQGTEARNVRYVFHRHKDFSNAFSCDKTLKYVAFSRAQESLTLHEIFDPSKDVQTESVALPLLEQSEYDMSF